VKKILYHTFLWSHKFHKIENYFIFEMLKKKIWANFLRIIELYPKKLSISSQKYGFGIWDLGSEIQDPGSRIQDPRSRIQDPRSRTRDPRSRIRDPRFRIRDPRYRIRDPRYRIREPEKTYSESRIQG
jgi:hypothetical protein